jgi:hypothetical protein
MVTSPPLAEIITRLQYSPAGNWAGGVTSSRTVARLLGSIRNRRGKLWIHLAAHGIVSSTVSKVRRYMRPTESVTG